MARATAAYDKSKKADSILESREQIKGLAKSGLPLHSYKDGSAQTFDKCGHSFLSKDRKSRSW